MHQFPSTVLVTQKSQYYWHLKNRKHDEVIDIPLQPRIKSNDLAGVYHAVCDGLGIADLPYIIVEEDIKQGQLIHVLPEWCSNLGTVQLVSMLRLKDNVW